MTGTTELKTTGSRVEVSVAMRAAGIDDERIVAELAELDEERPLEGEALLALIEGRPVAALSLSDGRVVADPFARTDEAVALLRVRAEQLKAAGAGRRWYVVSRARLAGSPKVG